MGATRNIKRSVPDVPQNALEMANVKIAENAERRRLCGEFRSDVLPEDEVVSDNRIASNRPFFENRMSLSITETAARLGLSSKMVERLCKRGELKSKAAGRRRLIPVPAIEAWLNSEE